MCGLNRVRASNIEFGQSRIDPTHSGSIGLALGVLPPSALFLFVQTVCACASVRVSVCVYARVRVRWPCVDDGVYLRNSRVRLHNMHMCGQIIGVHACVVSETRRTRRIGRYCVNDCDDNDDKRLREMYAICNRLPAFGCGMHETGHRHARPPTPRAIWRI